MRLSLTLINKVGEMTIKYSNLPESYIKRAMEKVYWKTPKGFPQYLQRTVKRKNYRFGLYRPWTKEFERENSAPCQGKVFLEPILDWSFFRGDRVEVLVGKDKGKQGIVTQIIQERNWVIVEGLNWELKNLGKTKDFPGMWIRAERPLLVTNEVALVDPADLQPVKIEWRFTEDGDRVRVSSRTGRIIPIPKLSEETYDYKTKGTYKESEKDTTKDDASEITFQPCLKTFEMDIMDQMGIKEDRIPAKSYWY